ncbi:1-deoxy-D-xylulose-5-phosphate synthase [Streptomyces sp. WI04-05B]|nr:MULTISPECIES: 1-deoxy-D-xylulose-5-phosphate synthase [unclassified Streptomyces]MDX2547083.1 1-deoxy-D-xylulose-5-phosphate synthase [Streptomyces sp. WI04-05B]MDX2589772.1 1-deoxy-D-xylulose-5-phosphate synthase [Streptomyces sp. WI04-05A]
MTTGIERPLPALAALRGPEELRTLSLPQVEELAGHIRDFLVDKVSRTGGHLGPNLGVVELTLALHRVFDSPRDTVLWDTGHQTYVHKILTGRADAFDALRQPEGLSGYPARAESAHDVIENSHASTVLSYADGLAKAHALRGVRDRAVVAVIGDGALTGGMAWEALNNLAAAPHRPVVVVLNDNGRSYAPTIGGIANHLTARRAGEHTSLPGLFENLGLPCLGPVDGHDVGALEEALLRAAALRRPAVVHCVTEKGRGHAPAERDEFDRFHAVRARPAEGKAPASKRPSWTSVFETELLAVGERYPDVVALTAAMLEPTGLGAFARGFPERTFDVGIAEQHAVTSAAGLALGGLHPVVAVYATFLNRGFDQLLMDVALHRAPVTFVLDRAGVTGEDGASHNGMWDLSLFQLVPGLRVAAPRDAETLRHALREAVAVDDAPTALRFPKGAVPEPVPAVDTVAGVDVLHRSGGRDVLLVSVGPCARMCLDAAERLQERGIGVTVVDPRWIKPVAPALIELGLAHRAVISVEDGGRSGGAGAALAQALTDAGARRPVQVMGLPQRFLAQGRREDILARSGLTADVILSTALRVIGKEEGE